MKHMFALLCLFAALLLPCCAPGETASFTDPNQNTYTLTNLTVSMPEDVRSAFAPLMREGDAILSGVYTVMESGRKEYGILNEYAVMAVAREGRVLLMGARKGEQGRGSWQAALETDSFIPAGTDFSIGFLPAEYHKDGSCLPHESFAIVMDGAIWRVSVDPSGALHFSSLEYTNADGTRILVEKTVAGFALFTLDASGLTNIHSVRCGVPSRLAAVDRTTIPRTTVELDAYAGGHQPILASGQAYICAVNLREKPTGQSRSLGEYSARVAVLGSEPGINAPWYNVRIGDTEGWVSGDYLMDGSAYDVRYYGMSAMSPSPARADSEVALCIAPGKETKQTLSPGTMMHVIAEKDGWLHVLIPRGAITAFPDWDGTYGYVREADVTRGATLAELKWK